MATADERTALAEPRHASWLELFYDLLFVALFSQLAHELGHDLRAGVALTAFGLFAPAWWAWVSYTMSTNMFGEYGPIHRLMVVGNMASLLLMTAGVASAFDGDPALYAAGFAASRLVLVALVAAWHVQHRDSPVPVGSYLCYSISAILWGASIPVGPPVAYAMWTVALGVEVYVRFREQAVGHRDEMPSIDVPLLVERFGLLVIIALGEAVVQVATSMADVQRSAVGITTGLAAFACIAALWWSYFDLATKTITSRLQAHPERTIVRTRDVYVLGHFFIIGAIVTLSAGLGSIVSASANDAPFDDALTLVCDSILVLLVTAGAVSSRLGRPVSDSWGGLVPVVPVILVLALVGADASPALALSVLAVALAGSAWIQARRAP